MVTKKLIGLTEQLLIVTGVQVILSTYLKNTLLPNLFLVWILRLSWDDRKEVSLLMAFMGGLIVDLVSRGVTGMSSMVFLVLTYANCFITLKGLLPRVAGTIFFSVIYFAATSMASAGAGFVWAAPALIKYSMLFAFYNALVQMFMECVSDKLKWEKKSYLSV